jgi:hypothetical protein
MPAHLFPERLRSSVSTQWGRAALSLGVGLGGGGGLAVLSSQTSPWIGVGGIVGLVACVALFLWPSFAFLLVGLSLPIERLGRLTEDSQTLTLSMSRVVGLLALAALIVHMLARRWKVIVTPALFFYAGYTMMAAFTIVWARYPDDTMRDAQRILGNLLFYFYVINALREYSMAKAVLIVWLVASVGCALYGMYDYHFGVDDKVEENQMGLVNDRDQSVVNDDSETRALGVKVRRVFGTTSHPTLYGLNLCMTLPFFVFFLRQERRAILKLLYFVGLIVVFYGIFLSNTRAVMLLAAGSIIAILLSGLWKLTPVTILSALLLTACVLPLIPRDVYMRSLSLEMYTTEGSGSFRVRFKFWDKSFELIKQNWLTGIGVGDQTTIVNMVTDELAGRITPQGVKASAHNEFIWSMVEVGLFGWLLHWSFVYWVVRAAFRAGAYYKRIAPDCEQYWLCIAIQIMLIGVILFGVQTEVFHLPLKGWWLCAGMASFLYSTTKQRLSQAANEVIAYGSYVEAV